MPKTLRSSKKTSTESRKEGASKRAETKSTTAVAPSPKLRIPKLRKHKKRDGDSLPVSTKEKESDDMKNPRKVSFVGKNKTYDGHGEVDKVSEGNKGILRKSSKVTDVTSMKVDETGNKKNSKDTKKSPKKSSPSKVQRAKKTVTETPETPKEANVENKDNASKRVLRSSSTEVGDTDSSDKTSAKPVMVNKFSLNPEEQPKRSPSRINRRKKKVGKQKDAIGDDSNVETDVVFNSKMTKEKLALLQLSPLSNIISKKAKDAAAAEVYGEGATFADTVLRKRKRNDSDDEEAEIIYLNADAEQAAKKQKANEEENGRHNSLSASSKKLETRRLKRKIHELKRKGALAITEKDTTNAGVVYLGHIPHGFYEKEIRGYFSQYGEVTRVRLSRSKKTARSRGFAFIEFADKEVAEAAAKSMDGYLMHGRRLEAKLMEPEKIHPETFKGSDRTFKRIPFSALERRGVIQRARDPLKLAKRSRKVQKSMKRKKANLARRGIEYEFPSATPSSTE